MKEPVRVGIVGCGAVSHAHAIAAGGIPDVVRIVACCDVQPDVSASWAETYGCAGAYTDCIEMIRNERLDAVLLATWPNQHRGQIEACLDAGMRGILCEKALSLTAREAFEIYGLVKQQDALLMEGFMYRHHPGIAFLEETLTSGRLGTVDSVRADFSLFDAERTSSSDAGRNWRQRKECGGGVPYDLACYCVNACNHFTPGLPKTVYCRGNVSKRYGTVNRMHGLIEYEGGAIGLIESSRKADLSQRLEVVGNHGRLIFPVSWTVCEESEIEEQRSTGWMKYDRTRHRIPAADSYRLQLLNFVASVRKESSPVVSLRESVINVFTVEALLSSLETGKATTIDLPVELHEDAS